MRVDYSNHNEHASQFIHRLVGSLDKAILVTNRKQAKQLAINAAQIHTGRKKVILMRATEPISKVRGSVIKSGSAERLCLAIAESVERIAAFIVECGTEPPYYYKTVRELASAEGAVMIWNANNKVLVDGASSFKIPKTGMPDILCFQLISTNVKEFATGWYIALSKDVCYER